MLDNVFGEGGVFSEIAGTYLEYERIQNGYDASGQSQQAVTDTPQKSNQVNEVANTTNPASMGWLTKEVKLALGVGVAVVALVLVSKK